MNGVLINTLARCENILVISKIKFSSLIQQQKNNAFFKSKGLFINSVENSSRPEILKKRCSENMH